MKVICQSINCILFTHCNRYCCNRQQEIPDPTFDIKAKAYRFFICGNQNAYYRDTVKNIRTKDAVALVAGVVLVVINAVLIVCVIPYLQDGFSRMPLTTSLKIPLVIPRIAIMLSMILMEFYHVYYLIKHFVQYFRDGFFSTPNEYDYFPEKLKAKYPNTGLPTKAEMDAMRAAEAAEYEKTLSDENEGKEDK